MYKNAFDIYCFSSYLQLDNCENEEDLETIVDLPKYATIINSSGWPCTRTIETRNKSELLQMLVYDEIVTKRRSAINAFFQGLQHCGVGTLLKDNYELSVHSSEHSAHSIVFYGFGLYKTTRSRF